MLSERLELAGQVPESDLRALLRVPNHHIAGETRRFPSKARRWGDEPRESDDRRALRRMQR